MEALRKDDEAPMVDLIEKQLENFLEKIRPAEQIRSEVDIGYSYQNNTVEIFEIRPQWNDRSVIKHHPVAKAKYIKSKNIWKIFWMPASLKWTAYQPEPEVKGIHQFLEIIDEDVYGCFFG